MKSITVFIAVDIPSETEQLLSFNVPVTTSGQIGLYARPDLAALFGSNTQHNVSVLVKEMNKPLGNLSLAAEMLNLSKGNDLDIVMAVALRSTLRISHLLTEFRKLPKNVDTSRY